MDMKIFQIILKTLFIYFFGWIILYFIYAFGDLILLTATDNNDIWISYVCLLMGIMGITFWYMRNRQYASFHGINIRKVKRSFYKTFSLQLLSSVILIIIVGFMEYAGIGFSITPFYMFLYNILQNESLASRFSFGAIPVVCVPNMLIISLFWLTYNIMQLLLDTRIRNR